MKLINYNSNDVRRLRIQIIIALKNRLIVIAVFERGYEIITINNYYNPFFTNFFSDFRQLDYVKIVSYEIRSGN